MNNKTWFIDFDGTLVTQNSHSSDKDYILSTTKEFFERIVSDNDYVIITTGRPLDHKIRIENFLNENKIRYNLILCGLPTGTRILLNDKKPDGSNTAYAYNLTRDEGIDLSIF